MYKLTVKNIALSGLLIALTFIFTYFIKIPMPIGYLNLGDAIIIFTAIFINPYLGALVGIVGAGLADLAGGYFIFIPFTILAKGGEALIAGYLFKHLNGLAKYVSLYLASLFMVAVYAISYLIIDISFMIAGVSLDLIQAIVGTTVAVILYQLLIKYKRFLID
jgi:uncharacterized membrane protein